MTGRSAAELRAALDAELTAAETHRLARELAGVNLGLQAARLAFLSSCSLEFIRPFVVVAGARLGFAVDPYFGPFGQVEQELTDPGAGIWRETVNALILVIRPEDVGPDALFRPFQADGRPLPDLLDDIIGRLEQSVISFRARSSSPVLVANFLEPQLAPLGVLDAHGARGVSAAYARANEELRVRLERHPGCVIWDIAGFGRAQGLDSIADARLWHLARIPFAASVQPRLAAHCLRTFRATQRPPAKCLALDLDNTLWGGVIGDDGIGGIQLGDDFPGNVFKDFQRRVLGLADRGILLALVSKNDHAVVEDAFQRHPEMLIRWSDLAAVQISWGPKSVAIREIARELNIGSDQIVFFDDNPVERAEVRAGAPEVLVADVPTQPIGYARCLSDLPWFDQLTVSAEDRQRGALYRERRARIDAEAAAGSADDFLTSLAMSAEVGLVDDATLGRIVQLINKTNQFNLTTRRYGEAEVQAMRADSTTRVAWIRVADRFGDQGLIGIGIIRCVGSQAVLDAFLMSCRVMNRRVEHALLAFIAEQALTLGCTELLGEYLPTAKNGMVRTLLPELGFEPTVEEGRYRLALGPAAAPWPSVISRRT